MLALAPACLSVLGGLSRGPLPPPCQAPLRAGAPALRDSRGERCQRLLLPTLSGCVRGAGSPPQGPGLPRGQDMVTLSCLQCPGLQSRAAGGWGGTAGDLGTGEVPRAGVGAAADRGGRALCVDPGKPLQPGSQRLWSGQAGAAGPVAGLPGTPVWLGAGDSGGGIFQTRCLGILGGSKAQRCRPLPACRGGFLGRPLVSPARTPVSASPQGPQGPAGASGGAAVLCPHLGTFPWAGEKRGQRGCGEHGPSISAPCGHLGSRPTSPP